MLRLITTDIYAATEAAILEEINSGTLSCKVQHRVVKYLNNIIEQYHSCTKKIVKPMLGFRNFKSAGSVISGIETLHMLKKKQAGLMTPIQQVEFIHKLMNAG